MIYPRLTHRILLFLGISILVSVLFSVAPVFTSCGPMFTESDAKGKPRVAVVNAEFANKFFHSAQNALGRMTEGAARHQIQYDHRRRGGRHQAPRPSHRYRAGGVPFILAIAHPAGVQVSARRAGSPEVSHPRFATPCTSSIPRWW